MSEKPKKPAKSKTPAKTKAAKPKADSAPVNLEGEDKIQNLDEPPPAKKASSKKSRKKGESAYCGCGWSGGKNDLIPDRTYPDKVAYCPECKNSRSYRLV